MPGLPGTWDFFIVPHTHWDREWYAPFEHFQLRLAQVVDEVIDVLERDPSFESFTLDGQAIVLEDYLEVRPQREARLRALLAGGRIEVGPSYILPDEFLVGAESLVRNLLIGRAVCRRFGAEPSAVGYLPDSFGHPLQLPQVLAGFGLRSFIFSRGMGDELDQVGVVFRWRAPDGSEVLALQQLPDYGNFAAVRDAEDGERRIEGIIDRFGSALEHAGVRAVLLCNGTDHLPVMPQLPSLRTALEQRVDGSSFKIASYSEYVDALGEVEVPAWSGELLGSRLQNVLRGVNSARLYIKRENHRAEQRLLAVETLAALHSLSGDAPFPHSDFVLAWRQLLRCQPHDTICGCSCDEVHRDSLVRYESLGRTMSGLGRRTVEALGAQAAGDDTISVFNPLPFRRRTLVEHPGHEPASVDVDGFAARSVKLPSAETPTHKPGRAIESDRYRVEVEADGTLTVLDKRSGRRFERLHALEDEPDKGDLYNFCPVEGSKGWRSGRGEVRVLADGALIHELELVISALRPAALDAADEQLPLTVTTVVRLVDGSDRIEFQTTIDNRGRDHRLRVVFPVGRVDGPVRAEGHFAVVDRPLRAPPPQTEWVEPPDPTQHTLGAVALGPAALITQGLPEYEARLVDDGAELCLTLLRCVGVISQPTDAIATRPRGAGPQVLTPEGQCLGVQQAEYALVLGADELDDVALLRASQDYRAGFIAIPAKLEFAPALRLEGDVVFSALKGAEDGDGLILRCFNPSASAVTARLDVSVAVFRTRLDESDEQPLPDGSFLVSAGAIATLRLRPR